MTNDNYCYDIHHNLAIDYVNGELKVGSCCQSGRIDTGSVTEINQLWNLEELKKIRSDNLQGKLSTKFCNACTKLESIGNKSRRHASQEFYQDWVGKGKIIRGLDIKLGNLCNLKCTICGPDSSTSWLPDAEALGLRITENMYYDKNYNKNLTLEINNDGVIKNLEMIKFWGGEPMMDDKHVRILKKLDQLDVLKNCRVVYNTNGTHRVSDQVLELWSKAHLVELYFSIDDIEDRFNYQRFGADWNAVVDNLKWYYNSMPSNHLFYLMTTVSYLNIWYLPELFDWKKQNFNTNRMNDEVKILLQPALGNCSINTISTDLKHKLLDKFKLYQDLIEFLKYPQAKDNHVPTIFFDYLAQLEKIRGTDWKTTFNEFAKIIR
jgi:organic radical activating enzyme